MLKRFLLIAITGLMLVACGGNGDDEGSDNSNGSSDTAQTGDRNYSVTISGDHEASIPPGSAQVQFYASNPQYELFFGNFDQSVFFVLAEDIEAGTHDLEVRDDFDPDQMASVEVTVAIVPGDLTQGADDYDDEINGTITLDEVGDEFSGSFDFSATLVDTADNGSEIRKTVEVTGSFSDLTVRRNE